MTVHTTTTHTNSMSTISQLLLAHFGSNFKQRVLGTYTTDYNCHHDICPDNICPGDISPYQQYLSCYWPDLDQTFNKGSWEHKQQITTVTTTFVKATFILGTFVQISNISISKLTTFNFSLVCILSQNLYYDCVHYQILPPIYMEIDRLHPIWPIDIWPIC